ncbi:HAMP domain-containing histidine kinase [Chitinophaga agrisoli]|uniref:histidine kinase n=2 Tax=Chitinophaga agrisoli TaxID=2607653 RepID=A0A5B2VV42_9BACT|nr:HAMP domain-containing histidine kinase [Chitinophaga agrisoli]
MKPQRSIIMPHELILTAIAIPVVLVNRAQQTVTYANEGAHTLLNKLFNTKRGVSYPNIKIILHDHILSEDESHVTTFETRLPLHGKKADLWLEVTVTTMIWDSDRHSVVTLTDISERKTKELDMIQSLEKEKSLHEMKSHFISMASHEFKTPLTAISSTIDLLETKLQMDNLLDQFYRHNISKISSEIFKLNTMLDEILTLSTIVSNNIEVKQQPVDVQQVITDIKYQYFSERKDERELDVKISGMPRTVYADKNQLSKIFTNLVGNAFKYSAGNPQLKLQYLKHKLVIKVADNGMGIPAADMPYLFNSFYRGSNVAAIEGTGLGLSIVKDFVERNNGTIFVESQEHKGTVFTIEFKYTPETAAFA